MRPRSGGDEEKEEERVLSHGDVVLLRCDLTILRGPHFLNDRIIAFYLAHLSSSLGPQTPCSGVRFRQTWTLLKAYSKGYPFQ
ncbi:hypothetical protein E2562_033242 [Oryza meyeriana var. granulata]|uniref:Uncharacterized protein n=1 Tax=Oryza meyeriana var. granulata TaxID=110450 RepID=A0A6G1BR12_9ORYZ|nr:hypothetical protein E2562_033242 [Oryza meyeriana var. granulata]